MSLRELIRLQATLTKEKEALLEQVKTLNATITEKEVSGEDTSEDTNAFDKLIADIKEVGNKLASVASQLERLSKLEGDETEEAPGADEDGEKNYRTITTKGFTPMTGPGNGNYNINRLGKQVEPKRSMFEKVIWENMAKYLASGQDKDLRLTQIEAAQWSAKHFPGHGLADYIAKAPGLTTKAPLETSTPIIPQNWLNDPIGLLYSEIPLLSKLTRQKVAYGQVTIPKVTSSANVYYVGENQQASLTTTTFERLQATWHEFQGISSVTKELMYFSPLDAGAELASQLVEMTGQFLQNEIVYGDGSTITGNVTRVKGLITQANASSYGTVTATGGTITASTVSNDFGRFALKLTDNNVGLDGAFHLTTKGVDQFLASARNEYNYFFPDYGSTRRINGLDVISSQQLSNSDTLVVGGSTITGALIFTVQPKFARIYDFGALNFLTSDVASWVDGGTQVNAWAQRLVGMQINGFFDFLLHQDVAVAVFNDGGAWSLSNAVGKEYLVPTSVPYSPAASGAKAFS